MSGARALETSGERWQTHHRRANSKWENDMKEVTIRLLTDWEADGNKYEEGEFLNVSETLAAELVEHKTAKQQTPEEYRDWKADQEIALAAQQRMKDISKVTKVHDRKLDDPKGGFKSFSQFAQSIHKAGPGGQHADETLKDWTKTVKTYAVEYDDSQGGYLVPEEFRAQLLQTSIEASIIRQRAQFVPMATNTIGFPAINVSSHASSLFGGIVLYRPGEAEQKDESKPIYAKIQLTLHKLVGLLYASDELLEDSPISLEPLFTRLFGEAIAWQEDHDFMWGTCVNQPLGFMAAGCLVAQAIEAAQPNTTIVYENIVNMWSRLHPRSRGNAVWLCNTDCLPQLYAMGLAVGVGGGPVFMPPGGVSASPYASLMGRPLIDTEKCETLGTLGDIVLCDFSQYLIGGKNSSGAPAVASSIHLKFDYDVTAFRFVLRYDGQPWWVSALTPHHSTITLSPFVALAGRP